ncbi:unnamed protein product [marine sediment metagenome]|uniref:Uncharacterized protein n=1 Tax=marine sediment metagenome TaxID=412755 RepID=X1MBE6_9ZZZZ
MPEPETIEYKGRIVGKVGSCVLIAVPTPDGKEHFEATCKSKEAREHLAAILEQEAILRVNPKVILEDIPDITPERPPLSPPAAEPVPEPVTAPEVD